MMRWGAEAEDSGRHRFDDHCETLQSLKPKLRIKTGLQSFALPASFGENEQERHSLHD